MTKRFKVTDPCWVYSGPVEVEAGTIGEAKIKAAEEMMQAKVTDVNETVVDEFLAELIVEEI